MTDKKLFAPNRDFYEVPECYSVRLCSEGKLMAGSGDADSEDWSIDELDFVLDLSSIESFVI